MYWRLLRNRAMPLRRSTVKESHRTAATGSHSLLMVYNHLLDPPGFWQRGQFGPSSIFAPASLQSPRSCGGCVETYGSIRFYT